VSLLFFWCSEKFSPPGTPLPFFISPSENLWSAAISYPLRSPVAVPQFAGLSDTAPPVSSLPLSNALLSPPSLGLLPTCLLKFEPCLGIDTLPELPFSVEFFSVLLSNFAGCPLSLLSGFQRLPSFDGFVAVHRTRPAVSMIRSLNNMIFFSLFCMMLDFFPPSRRTPPPLLPLISLGEDSITFVFSPTCFVYLSLC